MHCPHDGDAAGLHTSVHQLVIEINSFVPQRIELFDFKRGINTVQALLNVDKVVHLPRSH